VFNLSEYDKAKSGQDKSAQAQLAKWWDDFGEDIRNNSGREIRPTSDRHCGGMGRVASRVHMSGRPRGAARQRTEMTFKDVRWEAFGRSRCTTLGFLRDEFTATQLGRHRHRKPTTSATPPIPAAVVADQMVGSESTSSRVPNWPPEVGQNHAHGSGLSCIVRLVFVVFRRGETSKSSSQASCALEGHQQRRT